MSDEHQFDTDSDGSAAARHHRQAKRRFRRAAEDFMRAWVRGDYEILAPNGGSGAYPRLIVAWQTLEKSR